MKIAYNPITAVALTTAPDNDDITFDLKGLNIFTKGIKFKGTDTTYSVFKKHTSNDSGGYSGLVPVPSYTATNVRFLREDGVWSIPSANSFIYTELTNQDLNTCLTEGKWYYAAGGNTTKNVPSGTTAYELYVGRNANGYRYQKLITHDGLIWFRYHNSSTWQPWVRWNTDSKVLQSITTAPLYRPVILGYTYNSLPSNLGTTVTEQVHVTTTIYAQPNTGSLWANKLYSGGKLVLTEHQSLANYVTLTTTQTITGSKTFTNYVTAPGFKKTGSSDSYVLLGGGSHRQVSDFMLKSEELANNLTVITKSLNVTQAWMDTGITSTDLPASGTYIVQAYVDASNGTGDMWKCYSSGVMSWYRDSTKDTDGEEIILHRSGSAYGKIIYLRTVMQGPGVLKLQIGASTNIGAAYAYTFKFKRII